MTEDRSNGLHLGETKQPNFQSRGMFDNRASMQAQLRSHFSGAQKAIFMQRQIDDLQLAINAKTTRPCRQLLLQQPAIHHGQRV